jgi:hypothetical protein
MRTAWDCVFLLPIGLHGGGGGIVDEDEADAGSITELLGLGSPEIGANP